MQMVNGNSINSINSIYLGGLDQPSVAVNSMLLVNNSGILQGSLLNKSNASASGGGSSRAGLSFADKLKYAYDK